jgi:hypothetical protein
MRKAAAVVMALALLQAAQAATVFSSLSWPLRDRGMTCSSVALRSASLLRRGLSSMGMPQ